MKNTKTIRSQLLGVVIDTVLVSLVLVIMTLVITSIWKKDMRQVQNRCFC